MKRYHKRRHKSGIILKILVALVIASGLICVFNPSFPLIGHVMHNIASTEKGWNLILINQNNYIPDDYDIELLELSNGEKVDSRIYPELQEMFDAARAQGYRLFVAAGYRTEEKQRQLLNEKIKAYEDEGKPHLEAKALAEKYVATPGTSEHQIGIAVDINAEGSTHSKEALYRWLAENAHRYGFIKRYPRDKTNITGVTYEPWHYRYVGKSAAKEMHSHNICLEEYLEEYD